MSAIVRESAHLTDAPAGPESVRQTRFIPVGDWGKYHPWPPLGGLRHLIFNAQKNGFGRCLRKVGSRVLIDEQAFFDWIDAHPHERAAPRRRGAGRANTRSVRSRAPNGARSMMRCAPAPWVNPRRHDRWTRTSTPCRGHPARRWGIT